MDFVGPSFMHWRLSTLFLTTFFFFTHPSPLTAACLQGQKSLVSNLPESQFSVQEIGVISNNPSGRMKRNKETEVNKIYIVKQLVACVVSLLIIYFQTIFVVLVFVNFCLYVLYALILLRGQDGHGDVGMCCHLIIQKNHLKIAFYFLNQNSEVLDL